MVKPIETLPEKLPKGIPLDLPTKCFPLTRDNMTEHLPLILRQYSSYDVPQMHQYEQLLFKLYAPHAQFHYPVAALFGRDQVIQFWRFFLLSRKSMWTNAHSLDIDIAWDPDKLQALVQMQSYQHIVPLAWLDHVIKMPQWKIWSCQVLQFEEYPEDGPGALRVTFHEELVDQFVYLGLIPVGMYALRTDPGTPLNWLRNKVRSTVGSTISVAAPVIVSLLEAVGYIKPLAA